MASADFRSIARVLLQNRVDFIIVGGVSAVLQGAPITTFDLDVVHATDTENVKNLISALSELDAVYRAQPERRLRPKASHLQSPGHQLLLTRFGPLDLLGSIGTGLAYQDLLSESKIVNLGVDVSAHVLKLDKLISLKEELSGEKDVAVLAILRRVRDRSIE